MSCQDLHRALLRQNQEGRQTRDYLPLQRRRRQLLLPLLPLPPPPPRSGKFNGNTMVFSGTEVTSYGLGLRRAVHVASSISFGSGSQLDVTFKGQVLPCFGGVTDSSSCAVVPNRIMMVLPRFLWVPSNKASMLTEKISSFL